MRITFYALFLLVGLYTLQGQNVELDIALGEQNALMVEQEMGIYDDSEKTAYLTKVVDRLVAKLDKPLFDYEIHIVPDMSPNAFALPGGHLYITTGMIPILQNEDELACIMGHEVIHSNNRHSVQQIKKSILPKLLEVPGNLLGVLNEDLGNTFNKPIETSNKLLFASYGRTFETEADDEGVELAAKAGYDPYGMVSSLSRLSKTIEVATNKAEEKSYFNDHPYTPDRTDAIENKMASLKYPPKKPISSSFLHEFDGILFGNDPSLGVTQENTFLHPELNFYIQFPEKWIIDNQASSVNAYEPNQSAAAFVTLENSKSSPNQAADAFLKDLKSEYKSKLIESKAHTLNNKKGHLLAFKDDVDSQTVYAYMLWIEMGNKLFKLTGIGPMDYRSILDESAGSLRELNQKDRASILIDRLKIVSAKKGETTETLSKRTNNKLNTDLTLTINDKKQGEKLKEGELIKVVQSFPYFD